MSCNCKQDKRFEKLGHVRIIAQQMANIEGQNYIIFQQIKGENTLFYNFMPEKSYKGKALEILQPVLRSADIETTKSDRKPRRKKSSKTPKL